MAMITSLIACSNSNQNSDNHSETDSTHTASEAIKLEDQSSEHIYASYINLKNDLVKSDHDAAKKSAASLLNNLKAKAGCESTALIAEKIASSKTIADQRKEFTILSADVIAMFKHSKIESGTIYVQHCPMANNGDGGDWLSSKKNIENPYYGDEMMECGAVVEEIKQTAL